MKKSQVKYSRGYLPQRPVCRRDRYPYRRKRKISWKRRIIFFWILFLVLALAYVIFLSPLFEIKEIKISGNRVISNEEIRNSLDNFLFKKFLIFFNYSNLFLITNSDITTILTNDFPRVFSIETNKDIFKKTIDLKIVERKEIGIFCKSECYYIDEEGVIFEKAPQTSGTLILVIKDSFEKGLELGENVVEKEFMADLIDLRSYLSNQLGLKVLDFVINSDSLKDLRIGIHEGWYVLFDCFRDFKNQLEALRLVLEEKIEERGNLEYIDLRIENRAYYK